MAGRNASSAWLVIWNKEAEVECVSPGLQAFSPLGSLSDFFCLATMSLELSEI